MTTGTVSSTQGVGIVVVTIQPLQHHYGIHMYRSVLY